MTNKNKIDNNNNKKEQILDPIAQYILSELSILKDDEMLSAEEMAKTIANIRRKEKDGPQLWRKYLQAVKQQAVFLARNKKIDIMRKGKIVDPNDFKGLWKMRLPQN